MNSLDHKTTESRLDVNRLNWQRLLEEAITKPGTLHEAYSRFWNYSLGNQLLALLQCRDRGIQPGPMASFNRWRELGRRVKRGEKALALCMPITLKAKKWDEQRAEIDSSAGDVEREPEARTIFVYKNRVFVLAQTEGTPYEPEPIPEWDRDAAVAALGISEEPFSMLDGNCQGYATRERKIAISPLAPFPHKTTFHEIAHIVLGHVEESTLTDGDRTPRSLREVEAEAVAFIGCETLGLPGAEEARGYIQHWLERKEDISEKTAQRILSTAAKVLQAGVASMKRVKGEEGD